MGRQSFVKTKIEKKKRNLGNDEQKKKIRKEAVAFPKTKYEKKSRFRFWNGDKGRPKLPLGSNASTLPNFRTDGN